MGMHSGRYPTACDNGAARPLNEFKPLESITAKELQGLDIPPLEFIVESFLPLGLAVLGAPPKSFKSYMCLDMCLCICRGFDFMGFKTKKAACLYMDLESTRRRPKNRINQILKGAEAPDNLHIVIEASPMGKGFETQVRKKIEQHPDIKVVVVDVFKKVRQGTKKGIDPYERDYEDYGAMKGLADSLGIAIILVTHTTKMKHPDDPFNELTGSAGVMGSIDVAMVIKKESREDETAKLYITGRDLEEQCYEIKFDKQNFQWNKLGAHRDMEILRVERRYRDSHIVGTIRKLVDQNGGRWEGTASEIVKASKYFKGLQIHKDVRQVGQEITEFAQWFAKWDFIEFHPGRTNKQRGYLFIKNNPFDVTDVTDVIITTDVTDVTGDKHD